MEGSRRQEMRFPGGTKIGKRVLRLPGAEGGEGKGPALCWQHLLVPSPVKWPCLPHKTLTLLLHIFTVHTHSQPHSPALCHFTQSSLPLFNWKTFCLLSPDHMMWDKCSNPYLWAFKDCNTAFTRQLFDSKWIRELQLASVTAAKRQRPKVGFAHKKVNNDTQIWKQIEPKCTL